MPIEITPIDGDSIPSDSVPNTDGEASPKRRGRTPGSRNGATPGRRATAADKRNVETALATMGTMYSSLSAGLLMLGKPNTAEMLASRIEQTQAANRQAFEASPALATAIARLGQVSSIGLFIGSNVAMGGMVYMTYRMESAYQRAQRDEQQTAQGNTGL